MTLLAVPATVAISCKEEGMDVKFTDKGPEMTIENCDNKAEPTMRPFSCLC